MIRFFAVFSQVDALHFGIDANAQRHHQFERRQNAEAGRAGKGDGCADCQ